MYLTEKTLQFENPFGSIKFDSKTHLFLKDIFYVTQDKWIQFKNIREDEYYNSDRYKRFIDLGLIKEKPDPKFKRRKLVRITPKGKKAVKLMPRLF